MRSLPNGVSALLLFLLLDYVRAAFTDQDAEVCQVAGQCHHLAPRALFQKSRFISSEGVDLDGDEVNITMDPFVFHPGGDDVLAHRFSHRKGAGVGNQPPGSQKGADAPLNEAGYQAVALWCCEIEMETFITRVIFQSGYDICAEGGLHGLTNWFNCVDDGQTFAELQEELAKGIAGDCPWLGHKPNCPAQTGCEVSPGPVASHRRRTDCIGSTTAKPLLSTQPPDENCVGPAQDIVVAIDASKSVGSEGWEAEAKFAGQLVQAITANGNPGGHQIAAYWFNKEMMYIPSTGRSSNEVGPFISDGSSLQSEILKLDYSKIRAGATDHPQVFATAEAARKVPGARVTADKTLILITDGETHKGLDCPKESDRATVEAEIGQGQCLGNEHHVCYDRGCSFDKGKCMCGVYKASLFKKNGYKLIIAGVKNLHHVLAAEAGTFERQMQFMASPNNAFMIDDFEDMDDLIPEVLGSVCA